MIVQTDNMSIPSSREHAQRLFDKNIELEAKRRRSVQARVPSDPNTWQQMRENYETIILEDYAFSEKHNIEYALWQLHYKRIEELRSHFSAAQAAASSTTPPGGKVPVRPDRITKIRLQLKTFLSEATGFYHDLILKIRSKCGLPLGHFAEDTENQISIEKDGTKSTETKQGLLSCHRCLIYLGDLARYKGLYAESDSKSRDYAAASSYYLQAASVWPSSGNPHHQLAILASYSGDELVTIYRYFRSIAVESPFSTARENLVVAFEKNRKSYSQLLGVEDSKPSTIKESPKQTIFKGRGKEEAKAPSKGKDMETSLSKNRVSDRSEMYRGFCIRFVRLNGILFTRTSLESFAEILSFVVSALCQLLSSGPEEELNFGRDVVENRLLIVRLVAVLVYTCHNVNKDSEGRSYAEILQRSVLLQTAFAAVFDFMGHIVKRCVELRHPSSSFLLPGILIFVEWLAGCPDVASGIDMDERQTTVRSLFWNHCISLLNKLSVDSSVSVDDDNGSFFNMNKYDEDDTVNRHALGEDFELRGFLPLLPAQSILDFSRKNSFGSGNKEEIARIKRILAAGKVLTNVVMVDTKAICYDSNLKKFIIGSEFSEERSGSLRSNGIVLESPAEKVTDSGHLHPKPQLYSEGDEDDEEIVFKPTLTEKRSDVVGAKCPPDEIMESKQSVSAENPHTYGSSLSPLLFNPPQHEVLNPSSQAPAPLSGFGIVSQHVHPIQSHASTWLMEQVTLANDLKTLGLSGNGHVTTRAQQETSGVSQAFPSSHLFLPHQSYNVNAGGVSYGHTNIPASLMGFAGNTHLTTMAQQEKAGISQAYPSSHLYFPRQPYKIDSNGVPEALTTFQIDNGASSGVRIDSLNVSTSAMLPMSSRKAPVSRPVRHLGPPPGFTSGPKPAMQPTSSSGRMIQNQPIDDYSWLDGYKMTSSNGTVVNNILDTSSYMSGNDMLGTTNFPFPANQNLSVQFQSEKQNGWQNHQSLEHLKLQHELLHQQPQRMDGIQEFNSLPEHQYQGNNVWMGPPIV